MRVWPFGLLNSQSPGPNGRRAFAFAIAAWRVAVANMFLCRTAICTWARVVIAIDGSRTVLKAGSQAVLRVGVWICVHLPVHGSAGDRPIVGGDTLPRSCSRRSSPTTWTGIGIAFSAIAAQSFLSLQGRSAQHAGVGCGRALTSLSVAGTSSLAAQVIQLSLGSAASLVATCVLAGYDCVCSGRRIDDCQPKHGYACRQRWCLAWWDTGAPSVMGRKGMQTTAVAMATLGEPTGGHRVAQHGCFRSEISHAGELTVMALAALIGLEHCTCPGVHHSESGVMNNLASFSNPIHD